MNVAEIKINAAMELQKKREKEIIIQDYAKYVEYTHNGRWKPAKYLLYVCNKVQAFIETDTNRAYDILVLQMPPQHGKSMTVTETLPSWYLGKYQTRRIILASYNDETAERFTRRNKEKIKEFGKQLFDIEISKTIDRATEFELNNNVGRMISRGIMGGITSNPANLIIIDDPVKNRQEADSETYRERQKEEWHNTIKTRMAAGAKIIIIQTRWHEDDLAGYVINTEKNVNVINLPCEAEENDPIGRMIGEALAPELGKDTKWLQEFKQGYSSAEGTRSWNALFQGRPTAAEGNMIKRHWFKYWKFKGQDLPPVIVKTPDGTIKHIEAMEIPDYWDEQVQSWDCTFKDGDKNDCVSGGVLGRRIENYYLLDLVNQRMDIVQTIEAIEKFTKEYPKALSKYIEDKANGPAVISLMKRKCPGMIAVNPEGGKEARAAAISPAIESGNYFVPHPMIRGWVNGYINQMCSFPQAANDDMVDMTSQALNKLIYRTRDTKNTKIPITQLEGFYTEEELQDKGYTKWEIKQYKARGIKPWGDR